MGSQNHPIIQIDMHTGNPRPHPRPSRNMKREHNLRFKMRAHHKLTERSGGTSGMRGLLWSEGGGAMADAEDIKSAVPR